MVTERQGTESPIRAQVQGFLIDTLGEITDVPRAEISADSALVGKSAILQSRELVELLLALEDYAAAELGIAFDWTSDRAMSADRGAFRTVGALADHVARLSNTPE